MRRSHRDIMLTVTPGFYIGLALSVLLLPVQWVAAWFAASAFHELCHYAAVRLCGGRVLQMQLRLNGAVMETDTISAGREIICALAGPAGGFLLLLLVRWIPRVAICACLQSLYNLLPILPLDGGRVVCGIFTFFFSEEKANAAYSVLKNCILILLCALCGYATVCLSLGPVPLLFAGVLLLKNLGLKKSCKQDRL